MIFDISSGVYVSFGNVFVTFSLIGIVVGLSVADLIIFPLRFLFLNPCLPLFFIAYSVLCYSKRFQPNWLDYSMSLA